MKRREFIIRIGGAVLAAPVVANLVACGDDDGDDGGGTPDAAQGGVVDCGTFTIGPPADGHNMPATITAADINAGAEKSYDLTGGSHSHRFTITAAQFTMLAAGQQVEVTSTNDLNHDHTVTIAMCTS